MHRAIALAGLGIVLVATIDTHAAAVEIDSDEFWPEDDYAVDVLVITNGATLTVAGGSTIRVTGELELSEQSVLVLQGKNTDAMADGQWRGEGVAVEVADLTVEAGSVISADAQGYIGGQGPGAGGSDDLHGGAGGGYGGVGGRAGDSFNAGGPAYGDAFSPLDLGSGGGMAQAAAGTGGGAIELDVSGTLMLNGTITANGSGGAGIGCSGRAPGGGSGGSISVRTSTLAGEGAFTADGGPGGTGGCTGIGDDGGGGAGGRIAVSYLADGGFGGFMTSSVSGGPGGGHMGAPGTMLFVDDTTDTVRVSQNLELPPDSSMTFGAITVDDAATLTVGGGSILTVENDFIVTGNSTVVAQSKNTGEQVGGQWLGTGVTINARNLRIDEGSTISADAQGYIGGQGPGAGGSDDLHGGAGGGYGGVGGRAGDSFNAGGPAYGDAFSPLDLGSGGGMAQAAPGTGGGAIELDVSGTLTLDGTITANGAGGAGVGCSGLAPGGGSGGSIFVVTGTLAGEGAFTAEGGPGGVGGCTGIGDDGGGGAGGRIGVSYLADDGFGGFTTSSVSGGLGGGQTAPPGTMLFLNTLTDTLRISQNLDFAEDSSVSFGAVTVDNGATLTLGGGTQLTVENDFIVTSNSTVLAQSKNTGGQVGGQWLGTGVTINARNLHIEEGSTISADAQGYMGGQGPGAGGSDDLHGGAGAGYGGVGGRAGDSFNAGGPAYGDAFSPLDLGSGGGMAQATAGTGAGAIELDVSGTLTLDGTITASGAGGAGVGCSGRAPGGGSGGSIFVRTGTLGGQGNLNADGGPGGVGGCTGIGDDGGGGAGGRIAVLYTDENGFGGFTTSSVSGGLGGGQTAPPGTMVFLNTLTDTLRISQNLDFAEDSSVSFGAVTVDNGATLTLGGATQLTVENDFIVTGNATVLVHGKNTSSQVDGKWQGAGVTIRAENVRLDTGSVISADGSGYLAGRGPGVGVSDGLHAGGGGGYGGIGGTGGDGFNSGGSTYGSAVAPVDLGSGGGLTHSVPGIGGGAIALYATDTLVLDGTITAGGTNAGGVGCSLAGSGGGSGGSVLVGATTLAGGGSLKANGGAGGEGGCGGIGDDGGGGGGGRIAIYYSADAGFLGLETSTAEGGFGGFGQPGSPGTIVAVDCTGDCNADRRVTVDELVGIVAIALDKAAVDSCIAGDEKHDGRITVNEIVAAANNGLGTCPAD